MKSVDWIIPQRPSECETNVPDNLRLSLFVSLLLHGFIATILQTLGLFSSDQVEVTPSVVRINLVPAVPLLRPEEPTPLEESVDEEPAAESLVEIEDVAVSPGLEQINETQLPPTPRIESGNENLVEIDLPEVADPVPSEPADQQGRQTEVVVPTRLAMQQAIRSVTEQNSTNTWNTDCNVLQRQNALINCDEKQETDFSILENNSVSRYFSTVQQPDTARQAQKFIGSNSKELTARLSILTLDGITSDQLINDLEAGVSVYSSTGNTKLQRLEDQINADDPAYKQMKRVMGTR